MAKIILHIEYDTESGDFEMQNDNGASEIGAVLGLSIAKDKKMGTAIFACASAILDKSGMDDLSDEMASVARSFDLIDTLTQQLKSME